MIPIQQISDNDLKGYLLKQYENRYNPGGRFYNNVNNKNMVMTVESFINHYLNDEKILSGYCTLYDNQNSGINIISNALRFLLDERKRYKKSMLAAEYGTDEYKYYKILQLAIKVIANSIYGVLGEKNSVFYNAFVQNSITLTAQDLVTTSIVAMEYFLADNIEFETVDDVLQYCENIITPVYNDSIMMYTDPISVEKLTDRLCSKALKPDSVRTKLEHYLSTLTDEQITRIYYKNNLAEVLEFRYFKNALNRMKDFEYGETVPEGMKEIIDDFRTRLLDIVYYDHMLWNRFKKASLGMRDAVVCIDTDSNFVNANNVLEHMTRIIHGDTHKTAQQQTLINIIINVVTEVLEKTFWTLTENLNILDSHKKTINMKNEFVYKRLLLTRNKKNYAGLITSELGRTLSRPILDMKGLSIKKTTVPKPLRIKFQEILNKEILEPEKIRVSQILQSFDQISVSVEKSLRAGETDFLIPKNIEVIDGYSDPSTLEQVRGTIIWNELEPDSTIVPPEKIQIAKLVTRDPNHPLLLQMKDKYPRQYDKIMKVVYNQGRSNKIDISRFGFDVIAIPKSVERIPEYIIPLIDFPLMVNSAVSNGFILLESLNIYCDTVKTKQRTMKYNTNIVMMDI